MEFVPILIIMGLVKKTVDFARYIKAGDINAVATQVLAWAAGFGALALAAHTPWAAGLVFGDVSLASMNIAAQIFAGIAIGSSGSVLLVDVPKALDNTQSAAVPPLIGPPSTRPPV